MTISAVAIKTTIPRDRVPWCGLFCRVQESNPSNRFRLRGTQLLHAAGRNRREPLRIAGQLLHYSRICRAVGDESASPSAGDMEARCGRFVYRGRGYRHPFSTIRAGAANRQHGTRRTGTKPCCDIG